MVRIFVFVSGAVCCAAASPSFNAHPRDVEVYSGTSATLTAAASGATPLTLQWYQGLSGDTSQPVVGATGVSLTIPAISAVVRYWVRASNVEGATNSRTAIITPWSSHTERVLARNFLYANGSYHVAAGTVLTSEDTKIWTERYRSLNRDTYGDLNGIFAFAQGNGVIVGVGSETPVVSSNGLSWIPRTGPVGYSSGASSITFGNGLFVAAVDATNPISTSLDGSNWTTRSLGKPLVSLTKVAFGNGRFVAVGGTQGSVAGPRIFSSSDGIAWSEASGLPPVVPPFLHLWGLSDVVFGGGKFVAVGGGSTVFTSPNGDDWTASYSGIVGDVPGDGVRLVSVGYGNGVYFTGTVGTEFYTSTDAISWVRGTGPTDFCSDAISYVNGRFLSGGRTASVFSSTDGVAWTREHCWPNPLRNYFWGMAYGQERFVLLAYEWELSPRAVAYTSADGQRWSVGGSFSTASSNIVFGAGVFVFGGVSGKIFSSSSGADWVTTQLSPDIGNMVAFAFDGARFVAPILAG